VDRGGDPGEALIDPVTGDELARISSQGVDLEAALIFARTQGGPALRQLSYAQRAEMLAKVLILSLPIATSIFGFPS